MRGIIYGYYQPITDKWYVGKTVEEDKRKSAHRRSKTKTHFSRAIQKYGFDSFDYHILFEFITDDIDLMNKTLSEKEIYFIELKDSYKNGYNLTLGGDGTVGLKKTEESKKKMIGNKYAFGLKATDETKRKLSEQKKGKKYRLGTKQSEEWKNKMSIKRSKEIIQYDLNGIEIKRYSSSKEAAKIINRNVSGISNCLNGREKTCGGFIWKFA